MFLFFGFPILSYSQFWTADFENTTGNNAWTTTGTKAGLGSLAANDCYQGAVKNIYYMIRTNSNKCSPVYSGSARYYDVISGIGSVGLYTADQQAGLAYLRPYWNFNTINETMAVVSPQITNTNATVRLYFNYVLGLSATHSCRVLYSTAGAAGPWTQIGANLVISNPEVNNFSASFSPGAVNFWLKFEYIVGTTKGEFYGFEFDDVSVSTTACAAPTAQPTALAFSAIRSISVDGSFTAASPAADDYLVVRTTTATPPTNPVNGTTYTPGSAALGGVIVAWGKPTSFIATGLTGSTQYWFWVYSFNNNCTGGPLYYTTSPLTGTITTIGGRNWIGKGNGGGNGATDFNTAAYWSPAGVPGPTEEAVITTIGNAALTMSANATVGYLTMLNNDLSKATLTLNVLDRALTINNTLNANINVGSPTDSELGLLIHAGSVTILGTANLGTNGNVASYVEIGGDANGATGTVTFKGDVNFGLTYFPFVQKVFGGYIFDGTGIQNVTTNYGIPSKSS